MEQMKPYSVDTSTSGEAEMCGHVRAGFPSPADDQPHEKLDLMRLLVRHPASTFYFRISGTSMVDAAMDEGDIIVVDRSLEPTDGCTAVCFVDGEFTVKRVEMHKDCIMLMPASEHYAPIRITPDNTFAIWGTVTYVIKKIG